MSDDLISRSALLAKMTDRTFRSELHEYRHYKNIVKMMPTAYDMDKVVERLEDMRTKKEEQLRTCADNDMADYFRCKMSAIAETIEIVKSGGIE